MQIGDLVLYKPKNIGEVTDCGLIIRMYPDLDFPSIIRVVCRFSRNGTMLDTKYRELEECQCFTIIPRKKNEKVLS